MLLLPTLFHQIFIGSESIANEKRINDLYKLQLQRGSYDDDHHIISGMFSKEMITVFLTFLNKPIFGAKMQMVKDSKRKENSMKVRPHRLKITQNVAFDYGIFHIFFSFLN